MKSQRLTLRPFSLETDIPFHIELMNTENWIRHIGDRNIKTEEDFLNFYEDRMKGMFDKGYQNFVLIHDNTNEKIGTCGVYKREVLPIADIGYALLPTFEGHGYIAEAIPLVINNYFENFTNQNTLAAFTSVDNIASQKILLKTGFSEIDKRIIPPYEDESVYFEYYKINSK